MSETADHTTTGEKRETLISSARGTVNKLDATADDLSHQVRRLGRVVLVLLSFTIALIIIAIVLEVQVSQRNKTIKEVKTSVALTQDAVNKTQALINTATGTPEQAQAQQKANQAALDAIARTEAKVDALVAKSSTTSP